MNDKTIIDEIQARADQVDADRTTLLSILAEIRTLPDEWYEQAGPGDSMGIYQNHWLVGCADQVIDIFKRTGAD